jgi:hypothetical protein
MSHDSFAARRSSFEESYFRSRDAELVDKLKRVFDAKRDREELRKATGIADDQVLDRMMAVNAKGEMLTAFKLLPLVEIAWADGSYDQKEADAVVTAAIRHGIPRDSAALERIKEWLQRGPNPEARKAWYMYAEALRKALTPAELNTFREDLLKTARHIAEGSGGILGTFFTVSKGEKQVLKKITDALTHKPGETAAG